MELDWQDGEEVFEEYEIDSRGLFTSMDNRGIGGSSGLRGWLWGLIGTNGALYPVLSCYLLLLLLIEK